jgi:trehalose utilization protein
MNKLHITGWNEFVHERENAAVARLYPRGLHQVLADMLGQQAGLSVRTATGPSVHDAAGRLTSPQS